MNSTMKVLLALALAVGAVLPASADFFPVGVPLNFNRSTTTAGGPVGELVGKEISAPCTLYDSHAGGLAILTTVERTYKFVKSGSQWKAGEILTYDTSTVTDTGRLKLRRINPGQDTGVVRNLVAIGQNRCDTDKYCWVLWSGPETSVTVMGATWLPGAQLVPASDGSNGLIMSATLHSAFANAYVDSVWSTVKSNANAACAGTLSQLKTVYLRQ